MSDSCLAAKKLLDLWLRLRPPQVLKITSSLQVFFLECSGRLKVSNAGPHLGVTLTGSSQGLGAGLRLAGCTT